MSTATDSFGFGQNDTGIGTRVEKFKGEKGKSYRLGLVWWPDLEKAGDFTVKNLTPAEGKEEALTPKFIRAPRNYVQGVGYVINKGPEYTQLLGSSPKMMIATIVVSWPLGKGGLPTKESLFSGMPDVMPWIFGGDKYEKLKKMHLSGYPMHEYDVQADCEDAQFQKFNFLPAKQCIFKEMLKSGNAQGQEIAQFVIRQVRALSSTIARELGQDLTIDQLREKMGHEVATAAGGGATRSAAGDQEVDDILGSMLDD
jgi:hypothetical protein